MTSDTTGTRIRAAREAAGLTQAELARRAGMSRAQLHQLETDWRGRVPDVRTVRKLADELGVAWADLYP